MFPAAPGRPDPDLSEIQPRCTGSAKPRIPAVPQYRWEILFNSVYHPDISVVLSRHFRWTWSRCARPGKQRVAVVLEQAVFQDRIHLWKVVGSLNSHIADYLGSRPC